MNRNTILTTTLALIGVIALALVLSLYSCSDYNVPQDTKHLAELHTLSNPENDLNMTKDNLSLFVDYSNCIASGMQSPFYQAMVSPLTAATKNYYSIKGDSITRECGPDSVYFHLNNVEEVNYAALDKAINQMAKLEAESVMLSDGELFTQTATKCNPNNPYMQNAFKDWLLKGHDIHIIAEPYTETYKGEVFNKKRFYIIFTDDRIPGNIYDRIRKIIDFEDYPQIDEFHLSGNYPWTVPANGTASEINNVVAANIEPHDSFEIQDWQVNWKNIINLIVNAYDDHGQPLKNGDKLIGGLRINKNAFGCYRISDIDVKVTNLNKDYFDLYNKIESRQKIGKVELAGLPIENFIIVDKEEFKNHGNVNLYFDINNFAPNGDLDGSPFNYFKIEIIVNDLQNILDNSIEMFNFDSIVNKGQVNKSISESLKNCVFDPELLNALKGKVLYTIYVKSDKYE